MDFGKALIAAVAFYIVCALLIGGVLGVVLFLAIWWLWSHLSIGVN